jgi:hypothetical protein
VAREFHADALSGGRMDILLQIFLKMNNNDD